MAEGQTPTRDEPIVEDESFLDLFAGEVDAAKNSAIEQGNNENIKKKRTVKKYPPAKKNTKGKTPIIKTSKNKGKRTQPTSAGTATSPGISAEDLRALIKSIINEEKTQTQEVEEGNTSSDDDGNSSETSAAVPASLLKAALTSLQDPTTGEAEHKSSFVPFTANSAPMGASLPDSLKKKIKNGEYVNLDMLLPSFKNELSICLTDLGKSDGKISLSSSKSVTIRTWDQWLEAFLVYASVYLSAHPEEGVGVIKHINLTMRLYTCRGKWIWYDAEFRRLRAELKYPFDSYIYELFEQAKDYRISFAQPSRHQTPGSSRGGGAGTCFVFQRTGVCSKARCIYRHECQTCQGRHPTHKCDKTANKGANARNTGNSYKIPARVQSRPY